MYSDYILKWILKDSMNLSHKYRKLFLGKARMGGEDITNPVLTRKTVSCRLCSDEFTNEDILTLARKG